MIPAVWEDTLILALRDMQWRRALKKYEIEHKETKGLAEISPGILLKFDGNAESKVGDVLASNLVNQFFLAEFKASESDVISESTGKGKYLFHFLCALCDYTAKETDADLKETARKMIAVCLAAHQLTYWATHKTISPVVDHGIMTLIPYLEGVRLSLSGSKSNYGITSYGYAPSGDAKSKMDDFLSADIDPKIYIDENGDSIDITTGIGIHWIQAYISWLAHDKNDDGIKIALIDIQCNLIAVSSKLAHLVPLVTALTMKFPPRPRAAPGSGAKKSKHAGPTEDFQSAAMVIAGKAHDAAHVTISALRAAQTEQASSTTSEKQ